MKILFLHGWQSTPGGLKPTYLQDHGYEVLNPALPDDDFEEAVCTAQREYDRERPEVVVGSSRGGAVAMNIDSGETPLVLLCPAWKRWGTATTVKPNTMILHARADEVVPFADSEELVSNSGLFPGRLIEVGMEHRLADEESLKTLLEAVEIMLLVLPPSTDPMPMVLAPEPVLKAALMTIHWATVFCRNATLRPDVPVQMVNDLMEAIHAVPEMLMYWKEGYTLDAIILHLSCFDERSWEQRVDNDIYSVAKLADVFRDRLRHCGWEETAGERDEA